MPLLVLGPLFFLIFYGAAYLGRWLGKRVDRTDKDKEPGLIVSASLGLLALLLGFTVSMAVSRYDNRRAAVVQEANAIGTFMLRTDLMPEAVRAPTLAALDRYVAARVKVGRMGEGISEVRDAGRITTQAQAEMWREVMQVRQHVPEESVKILLVESANGMFDMATVRDAALANRLPPTLVLLLIFFPIASLILIGYAGGDSLGMHLVASTELVLLLTLVLLLIADLNRPRSGSIITPQAALLDVQAQVKARSIPQS
ncbi:bestrophin-like domain [Sandaracinobacteroides hominis]|uniref:bestrophin-like domain n=1 Tax=Sandaracinobacteroides hominis TaxID=2780086 RepID=UPI0018F515FB|nr:hypothetical protein [Sandaracinobacteroides hominis]